MIVRWMVCPRALCSNRRVRKDGTMMRHRFYEWPVTEIPCSGTGKPAVASDIENGVHPIGVLACTKCRRTPAVRDHDLCCDCQADVAGVA